MKRGSNISYLVFILAVVVFAGFIMATSGSLAPSTAEAGDNVQMLWFNVTNTSSTGNNLTQVTLNITGTANFGNLSSVSISDGTTSYSNSSIDSSTILVDVSNAQITAETNFTVNFTLSSNATWNKTFQAYVTAITSQSNVTYSAPPYNSDIVTINESTAPSISAAQKIDSSRTSINTDFASSKCSDSGEAASGISTCVLSSSGGTIEDGDKITGLSCGTSYDVTITGTDNAGNKATNTESLSTDNCAGGSGIIPPEGPPTKVHSFAKITPGVASVVKDFDSEIGLKEITINVNNEAQNVKITVTKHDGKPAGVSVEKSGTVYQYLQIEEENLGSSLSSADVEFRVEKSWASNNGLQRDDVSVYRFDESAGSWEELGTTFSSEDSTYNYYSVELNSFSYFAVSEKSVAEDGTGGTRDRIGSGQGNLTWLWILIGVVLLGIIIWLMSKKK